MTPPLLESVYLWYTVYPEGMISLSKILLASQFLLKQRKEKLEEKTRNCNWLSFLTKLHTLKRQTWKID